MNSETSFITLNPGRTSFCRLLTHYLWTKLLRNILRSTCLLFLRIFYGLESIFADSREKSVETLFNHTVHFFLNNLCIKGSYFPVTDNCELTVEEELNILHHVKLFEKCQVMLIIRCESLTYTHYWFKYL